MAPPRKAAYAEESAEVEVLFANMDKLKTLTKKIQGSLNRLETSGRTVQDAIGPIYGNTQRLQVTNSNIDRVIEAIDRIREPLDRRNREERIIRAGPQNVGLQEYMASIERTNAALEELRSSNLRSNQQAISELNALLAVGSKQLQDVFRSLLKDEVRSIEPLHYITKQLPFPLIANEKLSQLRIINTHISASANLMSQKDGREARETPSARVYAEIRGSYLQTTLKNLAQATASTARKTNADAIYRQGSNGIGTYAKAMEGIYLAEYENICPVFMREEWARVYASTCQASMTDFSKTVRDLNTHIQNNLVTDCFLAYEVVDVVSRLALRLEDKTGELKRPVFDALKPIRDTAKRSLSQLLDDTRDKIQALIQLPMDGAALPITADTMVRLQTMTAYLSPLSSIMTSLGDGGWKAPASSATSSNTSLPNLKSFDVAPDSQALFAHYATDTIDTLLSNLDSKSRTMLKGRSLQGLFIANNVALVDRMIRNSELMPLLPSSTNAKVEGWRKKGISAYLEAWQDPSRHLMDVQYTNRAARPPSGGQAIDSAAIVKALGSKDRDAIKKKFESFNTSFDELVARHKSYKMEKEVRERLAKEVQAIIEPLYGRFWDRYHEVDKGKGKYVKYDKGQLSQVLAGLT